MNHQDHHHSRCCCHTNLHSMAFWMLLKWVGRERRKLCILANASMAVPSTTSMTTQPSSVGINRKCEMCTQIAPPIEWPTIIIGGGLSGYNAARTLDTSLWMDGKDVRQRRTEKKIEKFLRGQRFSRQILLVCRSRIAVTSQIDGHALAMDDGGDFRLLTERNNFSFFLIATLQADTHHKQTPGQRGKSTPMQQHNQRPSLFLRWP